MTRSSHGSVVILSSTVGICGDKSKERLCDEYGLPVYIYVCSKYACAIETSAAIFS